MRLPCVVALVLSLGMTASAGATTLLIGNTTGGNIVIADTVKSTIKEFIAAGSGGLVDPDDLTYGPDGNLYVSSGNNTSGAILRFDGRTGAFIDVFATSNLLKRPYGNVFGPDGNLYVASFRSDQILRFNGQTGAFIDVFAQGNGQADGLNGPNDLLFGADGKLYVTTQGSVADGTGGISFSFESQVLRYDINTGTGSVFAQQPPPSADSFGFVSFLGLATGPDGNIWTSDFANGLRAYDPLTGSLVKLLNTNYTGTVPSNNFIGNLAFDAGKLFVTGFDFTQNNVGALLSFDIAGGVPGFTTFFQNDAALVRPIGVAIYEAQPIPLPAGFLLLGSAIGLMGFAGWRARAKAAG